MKRHRLASWAIVAATLGFSVSAALAAPATADAPAKIKADFVTTDYPGDPLEDQHLTVKATEAGKGKLTWENPFTGWRDIDPADVGLPPGTDMKAYGKELWLEADVACAFVDGSVGSLAAVVTRTGTTGFGFPEVWLGTWLVLELNDMGPGGGADTVGGAMVSESQALDFCASGELSGIPLDGDLLVSGDISVRS